jgi:N-acetylglutamate synthase-like GNAT family acetyltransferase
MSFVVRPSTKKDRNWITEILIDNCASNIIVTRGITYEADKLPGIIVEIDGKRVGLLTYNIKNNDFEIVTMNAIDRGKGIGTALLHEIESVARKNRCKRLWLITTNDNTDAIRFYQMQGFEIAAVHRHAIAESRKIKPQLPFVGMHGIPIRDEIEMEMLLEEK